MVKKFFRPFISAACAALSIMFGFGSVMGTYATAADVEMVTEAPTETVTEAVDAALAEAAPSEEATEATEQAEQETAAPAPESVSEPETSGEALEAPVEAQEAPQTDVQQDSESESSQQANETQQDETGSGASDQPETGQDGSESNGESKSNGGSESNKESGSGKEPGSGETPGTGDEKQEERAAAKLSYDKDSYQLNDTIEATIKEAKDEASNIAFISYDIPSGTSFQEIKTMPTFKDAMVEVQYKDDVGVWKKYEDYMDPANVHGIGIKAVANEGAQGIAQDGAFVVKLLATGPVDVSTEAKTTFTKDADIYELKSAARLFVQAEVVSIAMSQAPELPSKADDVRQTVSVTYNYAADSMITYEPDPACDVKAVEIGSNTFLEGGKAVVTSNAGDTTIDIAATMDLQPYQGVKKIVFLPKIKAYAGMEAKFTAVLGIREEVEKLSSTVTVAVGPQESQQTFTKTLTSNVAYCVVEKPVISHPNELVGFGKDLVLKFGGVGMKAYGMAGNLEYEVQVPDFAELKEIKLPSLSGSDAIDVFLVKAEDKDGEADEPASIGSFKPGETVKVAESGYSAARLVIHPSAEGTPVSMAEEGALTFTNNNKKNKTNYFAFRATAKAVCNSAEYSESSEIIGATFEIFKRTEPDPLPPQSNSVQKLTEPAPANPVESEPTTEKPETEDSARKKEEADRKEQIKNEALVNEQALKEKKKSLLAERLSAIRSNAAGSVAVSAPLSGTSAAQDKVGVDDSGIDFSDWAVKPIMEGIVNDLTKANRVSPVSEAIVAAVAEAMGAVED